MVAVALALLVFLLLLPAAALVGPRPPTYAISPVVPREAGDSLRVDTVTLDARDTRRWVRFDFSTGAPAAGDDPLGWDLAARRFRLLVNGGEGFAGRAGVRETGAPFDSVREAPASGFLRSLVTPGADSVTPALDGWYRYGFLTHLLEPRPSTWIVRTADGRYARLRILSYYCPGPEPGCLTFEYAYQGDGSRRLVP